MARYVFEVFCNLVVFGHVALGFGIAKVKGLGNVLAVTVPYQSNRDSGGKARWKMGGVASNAGLMKDWHEQLLQGVLDCGCVEECSSTLLRLKTTPHGGKSAGFL